MNKIHEEILEKVELQNPIFANTLKNEYEIIKNEFSDLNNELIEKTLNFLNSYGKNLDYAIECYLRKDLDLFEERLDYFRTRKYKHESFNEINSEIYNNPEIMEYHTIGLIILELLMSLNYKELSFMLEVVQEKNSHLNNLLEIGGGPGMYVWEIAKQLKNNFQFDFD